MLFRIVNRPGMVNVPAMYWRRGLHCRTQI